jgi:hypothetical protein
MKNLAIHNISPIAIHKDRMLSVRNQESIARAASLSKRTEDLKSARLRAID